MSNRFRFQWFKCLPGPAMCLALMLMPHAAGAQVQPVTVTVGASDGAELAPGFLGLSYEASMLLATNGHYYFDAHDQALLNTFKTLGIKSLRVGANAVDDPRIPVPQAKDIDALFSFARAAGVKVIYSFRLKAGNPDESARLARYIAARDGDVLDCFAIGNEPSFYLKTFPEYFAQWEPQYDAILKAVPDARFDGPSVAGKGTYVLDLTRAIFPGGHLAMASDHYYFLGSGRAAEKDPVASRARFLSNRRDGDYAYSYAQVGGVLAGLGVPYRIDEMNSCYNGGAQDSSDTFASTLWSLDCTHWWAAHHILGVNFHTGELVGRDGKFGPPNYAAFLHVTNGPGFIMRPQAYGLLAFTQGAHGQPLGIRVSAAPAFDFNAYAYQDGNGSSYVTLINKSYGDHAQTAWVSLRLPANHGPGAWQRMDLTQADHDVAAKTGVALGDAAIDAQGNWLGQWQLVNNGGNPSGLVVQVASASAAILRFSPTK